MRDQWRGLHEYMNNKGQVSLGPPCRLSATEAVGEKLQGSAKEGQLHSIPWVGNDIRLSLGYKLFNLVPQNMTF